MKNLKSFPVKFPVPQGFNLEECYPFEVDCLKSETWEENPEVLFIIGFVDSGDIKNGELLTSSPAKDVFEIILDGARDHYQTVTGKKVKMPNIAVINFNYHRNMHLKGVQLDVSMSKATKRCHKLIQKLKPKRIVCFGKEAAGWILGDISLGIHFGMPKKLTLDSHECILIPVPSYHNTIMRLDEDASEEDYDEAITNANVVGYMSRCASTMFSGKMLFTANVTPNFVELKTYKEVDDYLTMLESRDKPFALDIETNSLNNYDVVLSTLQFATDHKEATLIVLEHEDSPFSDKAKARIYKRLRTFVSNPKPKTYIIGQNISYDFRILRHLFGLPVIYWGAWDTMGGEHALDENLRDMNTKLPGERSSRNYALDKICLRYGIEWYASAEFGKSQRHLICETKLDDSVRGYMAMDVQSVMAIHHLQHKRAMNMPHEGGSYLTAFHNYVLYVLGNCTTHTISTMEHRGIQLSEPMFKALQGPKSTLKAKIESIKEELYSLDTVKVANRHILTERGAPTMGLWGEIHEWVFSVGKEAHVQKLFLDVLNIEDYEERKDGRGAKVGKVFQGKYKEEHKEVELYGEYKKHSAIMSTYIKGWQKKISKNSDSTLDFRIRPSYSYLLVTGRSNSFNPNLQNVPEHHSSAKFVKQTMRAPIGYLKMDADYSSHEVRCWALASNDPNLVTTFKTSLQYIYKLRKLETQLSYLGFKYESDTHKINYSGFTGVPVKEVTKDQRQSAKGIVFGSMYGIGDGSLAKSINKTLEETRDIKGKFFKRYAKGAKWMTDQCNSTIENNYIVSMLGRRRNLDGHKIPVPTLQAAFERRAQNSPIQGVASDFGYIAARLYTLAIDKFCRDFDIIGNEEYLTDHGWENQMTEFDRTAAFAPAGIDSMVHDSIKSQVRYDMIFVAIHLKEWAMTTGVRKYVKKHLGVNFSVDLGVEFDVGASGSTMETWNWTSKDLKIKEKKDDGTIDEYEVLGLPTLVKNALQEQVDGGYDINVNKLMKEAQSLYDNSIDYLESTFPLPYARFRDHGVVN